MRLGFAVKVLGAGGLPSHDTRRWQSGPDLSVSLDRLEAILSYLDDADIRFYRMATSLAPYASHPELTQFRDQPARCAERLAAVGARARELGIRLTSHPGQYTVLNSENPEVRRLAAAELEVQAELMDGMGLGEESVVVLHVGGAAGGVDAGIERFEQGFELLSDAARARLVVENDDRSYGLGDVLRLAERDRPSGRLGHAAPPLPRPARDPGPRGARARAGHLAGRSDAEDPLLDAEDRARGAHAARRAARRAHDRPAAAAGARRPDRSDRLRVVPGGGRRGPDFDVMLEAKAKDLALLRLREQLRASGARA